MKYSRQELRLIYDRASGYCHLCGAKLAFTNYGKHDKKGAWEVEHSNPRAQGGTDYRSNLLPAHITCNRSKGAMTTRTARSWHGRSRAPLSRERREEVRQDNALLGGAAGALMGSVFGPWGAAAGAVIGGRLGYKKNPDR